MKFALPTDGKRVHTDSVFVKYLEMQCYRTIDFGDQYTFLKTLKKVRRLDKKGWKGLHKKKKKNQLIWKKQSSLKDQEEVRDVI